jgi:hypothetical protein
MHSERHIIKTVLDILENADYHDINEDIYDEVKVIKSKKNNGDFITVIDNLNDLCNVLQGDSYIDNDGKCKEAMVILEEWLLEYEERKNWNFNHNDAKSILLELKNIIIRNQQYENAARLRDIERTYFMGDNTISINEFINILTNDGLLQFKYIVNWIREYKANLRNKKIDGIFGE